MGDDRDCHYYASLVTELEREPNRESIDEAMDRQTASTDCSDLPVRLRLIWIVTVVEDDRLLGDQETDEAGGRERPDTLKVRNVAHCLGEHVDQRDCDDPGASRSGALNLGQQ